MLVQRQIGPQQPDSFRPSHGLDMRNQVDCVSKIGDVLVLAGSE